MKRVAIITSSDMGYQGKREDLSGPAIREIVEKEGYQVVLMEILPDDRPPTRKQEQLITKLTKDFPEAKELGEYSDYKDKPTKANASFFITRALEEN